MNEKPTTFLCNECSLKFSKETDGSICPDCLDEHSLEWREAELGMEAVDEEANHYDRLAHADMADHPIADVEWKEMLTKFDIEEALPSVTDKLYKLLEEQGRDAAIKEADRIFAGYCDGSESQSHGFAAEALGFLQDMGEMPIH